MIEVCCAIILKGAKMLAVQRGLGSSHPGKWEFPGGKKLPSESAEQCIVREIEEELNIEIETLNRLQRIEFEYKGAKPFCLIPFTCRIVSGEIHLTEHMEQRWLGIDEWDSLDWLEADRELIVLNSQELMLLLQKNIP